MRSQIKTTVSRKLLNNVEDSQRKVQAVKNDDIQEANGLLRTFTGNEHRQEKTTIIRKLFRCLADSRSKLQTEKDDGAQVPRKLLDRLEHTGQGKTMRAAGNWTVWRLSQEGTAEKGQSGKDSGIPEAVR